MKFFAGTPASATAAALLVVLQLLHTQPGTVAAAAAATATVPPPATAPAGPRRRTQWWAGALGAGDLGGGGNPNPRPTPRPPTRPPPTLPTGGDYLQFVEREPDFRLGRCEGDCDKDSECQGGLVCFEPEDRKEFAWGCVGEVDGNTNYCIDPDEIPPTVAPTAAPTRKPTRSPTLSPTGRPSKSPTPEPTSSPTPPPSPMPSPKPTVPEKLFMLLDPVVLRLTFPAAVEIPTDKRDNRIIRHHLAKILASMFREEFPSRFFWEAELDVQSIDEGNNGGRRVLQQESEQPASTKTLAYEISGEAAFVDIPGTILPTREKLRDGMTDVLNANAIYKELQDTNHPVLGFVESLEVSWADDNQKMAQSTRGGGEAGGANTTQKVVGSILFVVVLAAIGGISFVLYKRKKEGKEVWTLKGFVPGYKGSSASSSDDNSAFDSYDNKESRANTTMDTDETVEGVSAGARSDNAKLGVLSSIATSSRKMLRNVVKARSGNGMPSSEVGVESSALPSGVLDMISSVDEGTDVEGGMSLMSGEESASGSEFSFAAIGARLSKTIASSNGSMYSLPKNYQTDGAGDASVNMSLGSSTADIDSTYGGAPLGSVLEADDEGHDTTSAEEESGATPAPQTGVAVSADPLAAMAALMRETIAKGNVSYLPNDLTNHGDNNKADASTPETVELNGEDTGSVISGVTACTGEIAASSSRS